MLLAKEELIEFEGSVLELLPDARFRVKLDNGHETLAYSSGRMKKNRIRILAGARLRAAENVPAARYVRDRLPLDRRRGGVASV